jgi:hypothetical protein
VALAAKLQKGSKRTPSASSILAFPPPGDLHLVKIAPRFIIAE